MNPVLQSILIASVFGAVGGLVFWFLSKKNHTQFDLSEDFFNRFNEKFPEIINKANSVLISTASQTLETQSKSIQTDLTNKKNAIEDLVKRVLDELGKNQKKLEDAETSRVGSFNTLREALENNRKITENLATTTEGLKRVLSNNSLRGAFGEEVAEDLLKSSGFVSGVNYQKQAQGDTGSRPDFTINLPDGTKVNIDVKFPYSNLVKMSEAEDKHQKDQYLKAFETDIKTKIKEVSSRQYINPEEQTVDFVILFIPNEMIFSFIYEHLPNIRQEAISKKVILAGPFSFTAILRMIYQSYDNFRFQKDIRSIIAQIKQFEVEFGKYNQEFEKLGDKIDSLVKQYDSINTTRTSKLLRTMDKINLLPEHVS